MNRQESPVSLGRPCKWHTLSSITFKWWLFPLIFIRCSHQYYIIHVALFSHTILCFSKEPMETHFFQQFLSQQHRRTQFQWHEVYVIMPFLCFLKEACRFSVLPCRFLLLVFLYNRLFCTIQWATVLRDTCSFNIYSIKENSPLEQACWLEDKHQNWKWKRKYNSPGKKENKII